jgi:DNA excision repair protein ERCC-3
MAAAAGTGAGKGRTPTLNEDIEQDINLDDESRSFNDYTERIVLKKGHERCPLWISPDNHIFLEATSPLYRIVTDFLIAIAEPVSRPTFIHEYLLTKYSLYAAVSVGLSQTDIIDTLRKFAKNEDLPFEVKDFIIDNSKQYGKARLVLKEGVYYIETNDVLTRNKLREIPAVRVAELRAQAWNMQEEERKKKSLSTEQFY